MLVRCHRCNAKICQLPKGETEKTYKYKLACFNCIKIWAQRPVNYSMGGLKVGFGKFAKLTFRQLWENHPCYCYWIVVNEIRANPDLILYLSNVRRDGHTTV